MLDKANKNTIKITVLALLNIVFYFSTFFNVLHIWYLIFLTLTTTLLEVLIFICPNIKNIYFRLFKSILYLGMTFSKVCLSIYFFQYGNLAIFSRTGQIKYLGDAIEYFITQITPPNISMFVLGLIGAILIFKYSENIKINTGRSIVFLALSILILSFLLGKNTYFEYYRAFAHSLVESHKTKDLNAEDMEALIEKSLAATGNDRLNLFKNYEHKNDFTGLAKDKNILIIQVESLQNAVIGKTYKGKEITPNLNKLLKKSIYFTDYFELIGFGNSSDSEYVSLNSCYSNLKNGAYVDYSGTEVLGLPKIAFDKGYKTISMHGNSGEYYERREHHPEIGFETSYFGEEFEQDEVFGMGLADKSFFRQAAPIIEKNKDDKWLAFLITISCHVPYYMPDDYVVFDNDKRTNFDRYLDAVHYSDEAIGEFLSDLEARGLLENTVVVIYGDHHALSVRDGASVKQLNDFLGYAFDYDEMLKIPLILYSPDFKEPILCENTGSQLDFMPTMLNLMGWNDTLTPMFGVDLLDEDLSRDNRIFPQIYIAKGSIISRDEMFVKNLSDNNGELVRRDTRARIGGFIEGEFILEQENIFKLSNYIYENDRIGYMINRKKSQD